MKYCEFDKLRDYYEHRKWSIIAQEHLEELYNQMMECQIDDLIEDRNGGIL